MIIKTYSSDDNLQPQFSNQYSKKIFFPHLKLPAAAEKSILLPLIRFPAFDSSHWALKRAQGMRWGTLGESKPRKYWIESMHWRGKEGKFQVSIQQHVCKILSMNLRRSWCWLLSSNFSNFVFVFVWCWLVSSNFSNFVFVFVFAVTSINS